MTKGQDKTLMNYVKIIDFFTKKLYNKCAKIQIKHIAILKI